MNAEATHRHAHQEAFKPVVEELVIVAAALAALLSIVVMLIRSGSHSDPTATCTTPRKRVVSTSIPMTHRVSRDFFYFGYNLGMTYQVSDTSVSDPTIRAVAFRHYLLSYVFGTTLLATTTNLVVGIVTD